jgi:hypothetical protein
MRSSATKRFGRRQLRQLSDLKEQIESAATSRFSSSMSLAGSFPRLRPRPLDEKRSNSSRLGESTPETRLVQVRILLPQPSISVIPDRRPLLRKMSAFAGHFGPEPGL